MQYSDIYSFLELVSESRWQKAPHLDKIIELLLKIEARKSRYAIVNMPPRHGKSQLISTYFPIWYLLKNPNHRIILTSYNSTISSLFGAEILSLFEYHEFGKEFQISRHNKSKNYLKLKDYAGSICFTGAGGSLTGRGADLIIIDDPYKNNTEANSEIIRDKIWNWFLTTAFTRLEPNGVLIIVMTRWHKDDLCGRLIKKFGIK